MKQTRILFVCHGNICRSVMAHYIMQDLVDKAGMHDQFVIDSAACRNDELGNPIYMPARRKLEAEGVPIGTHRARKLTVRDSNKWDLFIGMDAENMRDMPRILDKKAHSKIHHALKMIGESRDVADPWYTGNFDATYDDLMRVCTALVEQYQ